ncbi:MAG: hypothetical protein ABSA74_01050 [Candidatus Staskawiczbacteria bacterium]|jgi:hypothetical protein
MEDINKKENKSKLVILIIVGVALFLIGGGLGIVSTQKGSQRTKIEATNSLSSKVVSSIIAYGQVKNIDGRNITLSNLDDNLTISIADNAQVYSFTTPVAGKNGGTAPVQQTVKFENIKIGDNVNVAIKLLPSGQLEGSSVIILPLPVQK